MDFIDTGVWKPINTLSGYECCIEYHVNALGEIKSTKGEIEKILKHRRKKGGGYPTVNLTQRIGRKPNITVAVHTLVALAFLPPPSTPPGRNKGCSVVKHRDGDLSNCKAANLIWVKRSDARNELECI